MDLNLPGGTVDGESQSVTWRSDVDEPLLGFAHPSEIRHVDDINQTLQALLDAGAETQHPVRDVGGGRLIAIVNDADGNAIGLLQDPAGGRT
jgi:hypothetical protein